MADGTTKTVINCPACQTPLTIPIRLEMTSTREGVATFDTSAVRKHVDAHETGTCTATITQWGGGTVRCTQPAGHYDETRAPTHDENTDDPGGWHWIPTADGHHVWADRAEGATPHAPADPTPKDQR